MLAEAIERALCESPKTRSSWAAIKKAAAAVGASKASYLPTLDGNVKYAYQHNVTEVANAPSLQANYSTVVNEESLALGWILYDFGARAAALENSRELLLFAQANHDVTLQTVFLDTASVYYGAQAAILDVQAKRQLESDAQSNLGAATARVAKGAAPLMDQLQANTALAQGTYERARAEGDLRAAIGLLAVAMSLAPDEALTLPELDTGALPDMRFAQGVHDLLVEAREKHPKVLAAAAQWQAARANVQFARSRGLPVVRLVGAIDRSNQPESASLGQPEVPAITKDNYIGIKIEIPLFDGFNRTYQTQQAKAQAEMQEEELREVQQQVAISIWSSVQALQTGTDNLHNTDVVRQSAREAFEAAQHRYRFGVGNITELLTAQSSLAVSEQQWIKAQLDWRITRLQLAASLGQLGMWALE